MYLNKVINLGVNFVNITNKSKYMADNLEEIKQMLADREEEIRKREEEIQRREQELERREARAVSPLKFASK